MVSLAPFVPPQLTLLRVCAKAFTAHVSQRIKTAEDKYSLREPAQAYVPLSLLILFSGFKSQRRRDVFYTPPRKMTVIRQ